MRYTIFLFHHYNKVRTVYTNSKLRVIWIVLSEFVLTNYYTKIEITI